MIAKRKRKGNHQRNGNLFSQPIPLPAQYALADGRMDARDYAKLRELSERAARLRSLLRAASVNPSQFPAARAKLVEDTEMALANANAEIDFLKMGLCA